MRQPSHYALSSAATGKDGRSAELQNWSLVPGVAECAHRVSINAGNGRGGGGASVASSAGHHRVLHHHTLLAILLLPAALSPAETAAATQQNAVGADDQ